jgi:putative methionine-R-sulfoxide reductase with GAF domain
MDIDSDMIDAFDKKDVKLLQKICSNDKLIKAIANYRQ